MKRKNGEGSIVLDKARGTYIACIRDKQGKRIQKRFKEYADASRWLAKIKLEILSNANAGDNITLFQWIVKFIKIKRDNIRDQSLRYYKITLRKLQPMYKTKLQDITAIDLELFAQKPEISTSDIIVIKLLFATAYKYDLITKNPARNIKRKPKQNNNVRTYTKQELDTIFSYLHDKYPQYYLLFLTLFNTGMRIGEALALNWEDIDTDNKTITINKTVVSYNNAISRTKTKTSERTISITTSLNNELKRLKNTITNINYLHQAVFLNKKKSRCKYYSALVAFNTTLKKTKIDSTHKIHDLRHTHASMLLNAGIPITDIAKRLGHSSPAITLNTYSHCIDNNENKIINALEQQFKM